MQRGPAASSGKGAAFLKGGLGCLVAFFVAGGSCVAIGGTMYFDAGGLVVLFLIGGIIGLIANAIYRKGQRDAANRPPEIPPEPPQGPPF